MSNFSSISLKELEQVRQRLVQEVETLRTKLLQDLDILEKKSYELNDILIEIEERNAKNQSTNSQ